MTVRQDVSAPRDRTAELLRHTLGNGLRVLLAPHPGVPRVAVCVTYGVGFRSERPEQEGLAHLFEHLMFRGSASLPDGRFYEHVQRLGAEANGTTHQDYTDYYQSVPAGALERALFSEADRMRAPRFTERTLREQLVGVGQEITERTVTRPLGGFPWPLLPQVLFERRRNAHDGFGRIERLERLGLDDCADFFDLHYTPGNAVLTLVGGFEPERALELIERHFGSIAARPAPPRPELDEPAPSAERRLTCVEPGLPTPAVALGYRIAGPERDLPGYLAVLLLSRLLPAVLADPWRPSGSCGFFGPLDARTPDALVLAALLPAGRAPEELSQAVRSALGRLAGTGGPGVPAVAVAEAARRLGLELRREHAELRARARTLGRLEVLLGRPELLDELPDRLAALGPEQTAGAAAVLLAQPPAVLVLEPGAARSRPVPAADPAGRAAAAEPAPRPARPPGRPRPVPLIGPTRRAEPRSSGSLALPDGTRVLALEDRRAVVAELRLRVPLGVVGLTAPARVAAAAQELLRGAGGSATAAVAADGLWLDAVAAAPPGGLDGALTALLALARGLAALPAALPAASPGAAADGAAADGAEPALDLLVAPAAGARAGAGCCLAVVADRSATELLDRVSDLASRLAPPASAADRTCVTPARPLQGLRLVERAGAAQVRLLLCAAETASGADQAARFLATALYGGYHGSRLAIAAGPLGGAVGELRAGRDLFLGRPRAWVRARVARPAAGELLRLVRAQAEGLAQDGPDAAELARAVDFCVGQVSAVFDAPAALADGLARLGVLGWQPADLAALPERLAELRADQVASAAGQLFGGLRDGVLLGDPSALADLARP